MSVQQLLEPAAALTLGSGLDPQALDSALEQIAARAAELDASPRFPQENFGALATAGVLQLPADRERCDLRIETALVRAVAAADASTARILDGHFNGVERLALLAESELLERELAAVARGELLLGLWGADPGPGEGPPAQLHERGGELALRGCKTFCSGAGGVQRALVIARDQRGDRRLAYLELSQGVSIDRSWYRASGLRASESHRVEFHDAPVLALLGDRDEIMREPWFSRDAVRTAATWAGIADRILAATVTALSGRPADELRLHALGRMRVERCSIDRWLDHAVALLHEAGAIAEAGAVAEPIGLTEDAGALEQEAALLARWRALSGECRLALAGCGRTISSEAVRAAGSRDLVVGGSLDLARRDLDLFLLQHRLDPKLVELGALTLADGRQ